MNYIGKIIDTHTHIFPEKIAQKATNAVGEFYGIKMTEVGLTDRLLGQMKNNGISKSFILSTATAASQVRNINEFLISVIKEHSDKFTAFGTVHPDMDDMLSEIDYMRTNGIVGIKFHPDFQRFAVDDKRLDCVYEKAQAERIPIIFHAGDKRYNYSNPKQFKNIMDRFPDLIAVAAHLGGYSQWDEAVELLRNTNLYYDTSSSLFELSPERANRLLSLYDSNRIMFGTDFPMWSAEDEFKRIDALCLSDEYEEKIMYKNAEKFLDDIK